ncbi:hypothetical protein MKW98_000953 [Papaver atlanticum]|uniref:Uncharacterized protein n=1 Tax=Papaver atlanticum TaxID=357466 RepID=A0AAD4XDH4_9MAGN|nr:hypothetical protein MKW98_000953 [Papaver atlanticum]
MNHFANEVLNTMILLVKEVNEVLPLDMARTESYNKETEVFIFNLFSPKWSSPFTE